MKNKSLVWVQALDNDHHNRNEGRKAQHILSDIPIIKGFVVKGCVCVTGWLKHLICIIIFDGYYVKVESLCFQQLHSLKTLAATMAEPQGPFLALPPDHIELQWI